VEEEARAERPRPQLRPREELVRAVEMQHVALVLGALILLGVAFYVGKKFEYWKFLLATHKQRQIPETSQQYADVPVDQLVEQALDAEREGKWQEVVERLLAAKRKNLSYPGIFSHLGKMAFDHKDFDNADKLFEKSIGFSEDLAGANYYRGIIATHRHDLKAAERDFETAASEAPFSPNYYYYLGEVLRLDLKPKEAIQRYEQAERRSVTNQDRLISQFKIRMARIEAAQSLQVENEVENQRKKGPLSVDWLMTAAALKIRQGHIEEARELMESARAGTEPSVFGSCLNDPVFVDACRQNSQLADVCRMEPAIQALFP
jgi:tetratricopeptide (TPR) repeat protein